MTVGSMFHTWSYMRNESYDVTVSHMSRGGFGTACSAFPGLERAVSQAFCRRLFPTWAVLRGISRGILCFICFPIFFRRWV